MAKEIKKSRLLVNVIGIPSLIACIFLGNDFYSLFSILICSIMLLSVIEWNNLSGVNCNLIKLINFFTVTVMFIGIHFNWLKWNSLIILIMHTLIVSIFYTLKAASNPLLKIASSVFGVLWIGIFISSMILIRNLNIGFELTLMMFLSVWACDTFAFVFGSRFGQKKMIPKVSPNKTWFGAISGFLGGFIVPIVFYAFFSIKGFIFFDYIICGLLFGFFSQLGDLFVSALKREANIKDTGNILNGHGGILDRFDSLSFVSPVLLIFLIQIKGLS